MGVSLAEYMRSVQVKDPKLAGVVKIFTMNAPILGDSQNLGARLPSLKWENTVGGAISWVREKTAATTAWRAVGTEFVATTGETEKVSEDLKVGGGKVEIDRVLLKRGDMNGVVTQQTMLISSFARTWNAAFYKGDGNNNSFTGLQTRISGSQSVDNLGGGINLYALDKILLDIRGTDKVIVMGAGVAARLMQAAKTSTNVNYTPANYGQSPATYNGIPILLAGEDNTEAEILGFTEAGDTSSVYVLSLGDTGVVGAQTAPLELVYTDPNKVDSGYIVEWDNNYIIKTKRSAYRLRNIIDAAANSEAP